MCPYGHRIRVGELDPTTVVNILSRVLDDNVDLVRQILDAQHIVWSASDNAGDETVWQPVMVFSPSNDMPINSACHLLHNASENLATVMIILSVVWGSNIEMATKCRLVRRPP